LQDKIVKDNEWSEKHRAALADTSETSCAKRKDLESKLEKRQSSLAFLRGQVEEKESELLSVLEKEEQKERIDAEKAAIETVKAADDDAERKHPMDTAAMRFLVTTRLSYQEKFDNKVNSSLSVCLSLSLSLSLCLCVCVCAGD